MFISLDKEKSLCIIKAALKTYNEYPEKLTIEEIMDDEFLKDDFLPLCEEIFNDMYTEKKRRTEIKKKFKEMKHILINKNIDKKYYQFCNCEELKRIAFLKKIKFPRSANKTDMLTYLYGLDNYEDKRGKKK